MEIRYIVQRHTVAAKVLAVAAVVALLAVVGWGFGLTGESASAEKAGETASQAGALPTGHTLVKGDPVEKQPSGPSSGIDPADKVFTEIVDSLKKAEPRTYELKMMARQLIRITTVAVVLLFVIAFAIPICVWLLGRSKLLGLPADVAATLISVEERQAKLVSTFKEIQDEMEELHSQSGPDLKDLIKRAEEYMTRNEQALKSGGSAGRTKG